MTLARKASKATLTPLGWPARRRRGDVVVLLYHRVGTATSEIELPSDAFQRHLEHLTAHERILTIEEAVANDPEGGVVVTFDDGYGDFHRTVVPLLVSYQVPAVLYLATGLVDGERHAAAPDRSRGTSSARPSTPDSSPSARTRTTTAT